MKIQKGIVKYKDRNDLSCTYGVTDDGKQYYFLGEDASLLKNGNRIVSTALVEAIDPMVKASNVGLIDEDGHEIIACENKSIKTINEDIILVEKAQPVSQSVIDATNLKSIPAEATKLVSTSATIKGKLNAQMGPEGRYFFNDQFSEATVCDINGNNLVNDEYFSFIGMANGKLYFSKNTEDSEITEYSILPPEVQSDVTPTNDTNEIDVSGVDVPKDVVESALNSEAMAGVSGEVIPTVGEDVSENAEETAMENDIGADNSEGDVAGVETEANAFDEAAAEEASSDNFAVGEESGSDVASGEENDDIVADQFEGSVESKATEEENAITNEETNVSEATEEAVQEEVASEGADTEVSEESNEQGATVEDTQEAESDLVAFANSGVLPEESHEEVEKDEVAEEKSTEDVANADEIKGALDEAMADVNSEDEVETESEINFDDVADDDLFKDSIVKADALVKDEEFDDVEVVSNDNIMSDVVNSMNSLINLNKQQKEVISHYKDQIDKLNFEARRMELKLTKVQAQNKLLVEKLRTQEQQIARQNKEIEEMRPQLAGKDELVKLLADAQVLLGQDDYSENDSFYKKVA